MPSIDTIYNSGLDALANLFEVSIDLSSNTEVSKLFGDNIKNELIFRIQNFSVPSSEVSTYEVNWGPWTFDRPSGKISQNREISMDIRVDKRYEIYQGFVNWKNAIQNEYTGVTSNYNDYLVDIAVYPVSSIVGISSEYVLSSVGSGAKFENCWVKSVGDISYDQGNGDPLSVNVTFNFLRINKDFNIDSGSSADQGNRGTEDTN